MLKRIFALIMVIVTAFCITGCDNILMKKNNLPEYQQQQFEISGFWAPYEITEESFKQYKGAGFNTLAMINHSGELTSEEQFYLGSDRTMRALELCKKLGLKAILSYNDWIAAGVEGEGYYSETPFTQHDVYGDYKDIISGVNICDEPKYDADFPIYANETLINDFKKAYPDANYVVNLIPIYGASSYGFTTYENMLDVYGKEIMSYFDKPYISVDIYPFHTNVKNVDMYIATNHEMLAKKAKEYGAEKTFILQAATGVEFEEDLSEGDMRWQVYAALAFGADNLQYYCYSLPKGREYNYCILNADNTPSKLYDYVKEINNEIQSFASAMLSYDWDMSIAVEGIDGTNFRLGGLVLDENFDVRKFKNAQHYGAVTASHDLLVSRFESEQYGEAYMFVNFAGRSDTNTVTATFKDCSAVAVYGGDDFDGQPQIIDLDSDGNVNLTIPYGSGHFIVPMA